MIKKVDYILRPYLSSLVKSLISSTFTSSYKRYLLPRGRLRTYCSSTTQIRY